jgi:hypothetical protein
MNFPIRSGLKSLYTGKEAQIATFNAEIKQTKIFKVLNEAISLIQLGMLFVDALG